MNPPVLLTVASYYGSLAAARCLGRSGVSVTVADPARFGAASWSRYAARRLRCPPVAEPDAFVQWLLDFGRREPGHVLLATSDELAWLLCKHRDALSKDFRLRVPELSAMQALLSKKRLFEAGREAGLAAPTSAFPQSEGELEALADSVALPLLIKPVTQVLLASHQKGEKVERREELLAAHRRFRAQNAYPPELLASMPEAAWPMLQSFEREAATGIYSLAGFLPERGEPVVLASRKVLQRPRQLGIGLCFEAAPVRPELAAALARLCRNVGYDGVFEAELIDTARGPLLIDFNPRFYSQMAFEIDRGLPLPWLAYLAAAGEREALEHALVQARARVANASERVYSHRLIFEVLTRSQRLSGRMSAEETSRWHAWMHAHAGQISDAVLDRDDPWPTVVDWASTLLGYARHPRSFVRRIVLENERARDHSDGAAFRGKVGAMKPPPSAADEPVRRATGEVLIDAPVEPVRSYEDHAASDVKVAVRSALVLNVALIGTWFVAAIVRFYLSRHLGPAVFGAYRAADAQTTAWFVLLNFGMETYIQKEIPVRPQHASDFFGGLVLVRALLSVGVLALLVGGLWLRHSSPEITALVLTFGVGYAVVSMNSTLASLLHASRNVGGLAATNVASKFLWGAAIGAAILLRLPLAGLAGALVVSEAVKAAVLFRLVRRHLQLKWRVDLGELRKVLKSSLPYYVNGVAITVYGNVDTIVLSMLSSDTEVGYYGAAQNIAGLSMFISPLIGWVLMPLLSRAGARSLDEMYALLRRAIELVITLIIPVVMLVALGADLFVTRLSGMDYGPAAPALRVLAPMFVLTYLAILTATCLNLRDRSWTVTVVSSCSLFASAGLDALIVPRTWAWLGTGGAGVGAAFSLTLTEGLVTAIFLYIIGRQSFDARSLIAVGKSLLICAAVVALDHWLRPMAWFRLVIDGVAFAVLALVTGTIRINEVSTMVLGQLKQKLNRTAA